MHHLLKTVLKKIHQNRQPSDALNNIFIHKDMLLHNLSYLQKISNKQSIFPVLKANAYGHGLKEVSTILKATSVPYICVDSFPEYQIVKDYAHKKSLIMGETCGSNYDLYDPKRATPVIYNLDTLKTLIQSEKKRTIHLFLNTGMNREGIQPEDIPDFISLIQQTKNITLAGVMSHLANADDQDESFIQKQIKNYKDMYQTIIALLPSDKTASLIYRHIANSAGIAKINDPFFTAGRAGIAFYGYNPLEKSDRAYETYKDLLPALDITSKVVALQHLQPGDTVSYNNQRQASSATTIATVPFGYYEGLSRKLRNNWQFGRKDVTLDQVGTICMNISCCDIKHHDINLGDELTIISSNKHAPNTIAAFAQKTETITYEVLVKLNEKIRRKVV